MIFLSNGKSNCGVFAYSALLEASPTNYLCGALPPPPIVSAPGGGRGWTAYCASQCLALSKQLVMAAA
jgi:hypothetical protein